MSVDERVGILLRAATRAEGEGDERVARILRRRAEESRPLDERDLGAELRLAYGFAE
ncbi:MAG: hypothetical protein AMXMBFR53_20910 [Gemmatimonadota bacterium]